MKKLLIGSMLLSFTLAGVLDADYIERERENAILLTETYKNVFPQTLVFDQMTLYPF